MGRFHEALPNVKSAICYSPRFYPKPQKNLHRYICHICDIMQLCSWRLSVGSWRVSVPGGYIVLGVLLSCSGQLKIPVEQLVGLLLRKSLCPSHRKLPDTPGSSTLGLSECIQIRGQEWVCLEIINSFEVSTLLSPDYTYWHFWSTHFG